MKQKNLSLSICIATLKVYLIVFLTLFYFASCTETKEREYPPNLIACYYLHSLTEKKGFAKEGDWRSNHPEEWQQSLKAYIADGPLRADSLRHKLYMVKIGNFDKNADHIFDMTREYLSIYFQINVDTITTIPLEKIPEKNSRIVDKHIQLQTEYILDSLLYINKPKDAFALLALSSADLYPNEKWNFVFGQAKLYQGIGLWSFARLGVENDFKTLVNRTLKVASHETGHMLSIVHCVSNQCNMNGSNSLPENDTQPEWLCWECLAKVCYNRNVHPQKIMEELLSFHQKYQLDTAAIQYYQKALALLKAKDN